MEVEAEIVGWEPERRLAWQQGFAVIEMVLEARGAKTVLTLVPSGFLANEDFEKEWFKSTSYGWGFILLSLQWIFARHPGMARQVVWPRVKTSLTREAAYEKLLAVQGLFMDDARTALVVGKSYALQAMTGEKYSGKTELRKDGRGFCISVSELNDALLWVTMEGTPGALEVQIWLSAFGVAPANLAEFGERWKQRLETLVGAAVS